MNMTREELQLIKDVAEKALRDCRGMVGEAVNWGGVGVSDVRQFRSMEDGPEVMAVQIWIDEASPDATGLQQAVRDCLDEAFPEVDEWEVFTEW